jgi:hypothetical protein
MPATGAGGMAEAADRSASDASKRGR